MLNEYEAYNLNTVISINEHIRNELNSLLNHSQGFDKPINPKSHCLSTRGLLLWLKNRDKNESCVINEAQR